MAELEETAEIESSAGDIAVASGASDLGDTEFAAAETEANGEKKAAEPPRRRLVAELLEGQEDLEEPPASGRQIVATPVHLEPDDACQPLYQLDLSSEEPEGVIVVPSAYASALGQDVASVATPSSHGDTYVPGAAGGGALQAIKQLIVQRERRVMAAERDGIGAYELAIELDGFIRSLLDALRRAGG